ncbi:MAG: hypothetical protein H7833_02095 [Magnetococcus sp. DMHC-1]
MDLIILVVGSDKPDVHDAVGIVDLHDQPVLVASHVENNPISREEAGMAELVLDIGRGFPVCLGHKGMPSFKGTLAIQVGLPSTYGGDRQDCMQTVFV